MSNMHERPILVRGIFCAIFSSAFERGEAEPHQLCDSICWGEAEDIEKSQSSHSGSKNLFCHIKIYIYTLNKAQVVPGLDDKHIFGTFLTSFCCNFVST